jgi:hypothetical protein
MLDFTSIDLSTIGDGTGVNLPTGVYASQIVSAQQTVTKNTGRPQFEFKVKVLDPQYNGAVRTTWISLPQSPDDKVVYVWVRAFQSIGVAPDALKQAGRIPFEQVSAMFTGRNCFIDWTEGNKDLGQNPDMKFITSAAFEQRKAAQAAAPAQTAAPVMQQQAPVMQQQAPRTVQIPTQQTAPAGFPGLMPQTAPQTAPTGTTQDLMALLGGNR